MPPNEGTYQSGAVGWHIMGYCLSYLSLFVNPFIYYMTNDFLKTATIKTFGSERTVQLSTKRNTTVAEQEGWFGTVGSRRDRNVEMEYKQDIL